ncbi:hypothetical protein PRIPAC_95355 [Pristionchus pacificus]|uniref:Uncharacterized protein n=1 Tax=Pristionchus pacificus TaxID=54126 RepID=A0A2A6B2U1_PRIPA|nr:hypothetical protein PRIPAC_95355 [Pristionchus pacificus]|eukprot:PDM60196.1 hypothetical protein PRIPAC_54021 [Pristionchus pacificus]
MKEKMKEEPTFCCCPLSIKFDIQLQWDDLARNDSPHLACSLATLTGERKSVVIFALIHTFTSLTALFLSLFEMKSDEIRIQDHLPFSAAFFGVISAFCILRATKVYNYRSYYRSAILLVSYDNARGNEREKFFFLIFQIAVAVSSTLAYAYSGFTSSDDEQSLKDKYSVVCEGVYTVILAVMGLVYYRTGRFLEMERTDKSRVYFYSSRSKIAPSFELP